MLTGACAAPAANTPPPVPKPVVDTAFRPASLTDAQIIRLHQFEHPVHHRRHVVKHHVQPKVIAASMTAEQWAHSADALIVTGCEAPDGATELDVHRGVYYFGKWQMDWNFVHDWGHVDAWSYVVGGKFTMSEPMQDEIAHRGFLHRGWQPWTCARIHGIG